MNYPMVRAIDMFAGMGGCSWGAQSAGVEIVAAVDVWDIARDTYLDNIDRAKFYLRRCEDLSPQEILDDVGEIQLLIASPECTNHSCARGAKEKSEDSRMTAFEVIRYAEIIRPRWLVVENVIQMRSWDRYNDWLGGLRGLGYSLNEQILNSSDFGVPQSRKRLFVTGDLLEEPNEVVPSLLDGMGCAKDVIELNGRFQFSPLRTEKRAESTLKRADRAIGEIGYDESFLLVYYGSDGAGGWQSLDRPLRTITTIDRFAYVRPSGNGKYEMRMLQVPELRKAMGFPASYKMHHGTRRDKVKLLGNAVCPPVIEAIINILTSPKR